MAGSALVLALLATGVRFLVPGEVGSVWLAAGVAYAVQVTAFALLVVSRRRDAGFMVGWGLGMLLRFAALAGMVVLVSVAGGFDAATALLSLVGFMMVLVLIEPLFLRWAD